ncbi:toll/interleukin-1 receptor domain-containing protein [Phormidium sp. FACHB-592]|uniref:Toll/interleukin-1 receptor domain-containing protein n=1 Tax=Stenomitos frigidus AS-A4 TaxID=2933935 RepID=A0ABV0KCG1_9CYAN|nr:toll/interleukin-1 receptor domain-containing protein [Phormidium sp. FACHB-592]MBD2077523.1 toll/interleukin-1 receptor domain-containing protein [Phormidium sp. FACHB-592]
MPGITQFFETDFPGIFSLEVPVVVRQSTKEHVVKERILLDFEARVKYITLLLPQGIEIRSFLLYITTNYIELLSLKQGKILVPGGKRIPIGTKLNVQDLGVQGINLIYNDYSGPEVDANTLPFTGRIFIYSEEEVDSDFQAQIISHAEPLGIHFRFRGPLFAQEQTSHMEPIAFISHDSRDKDTIVRPLAQELQRMMLSVWYDEFSLEVGDSLRGSIEAGLKRCQRCIFVLTPNFLGKGGWPKREYDSIFTRELVEERNLILPIWSEVTRNEVFEYSPTLADRVALNWNLGLDEVASRLYRKLTKDGS